MAHHLSIVSQQSSKGASTPVAVFWHRRDLRLHDNTALFHALRCGVQVLPLFIFDTDILSKLEEKSDARVHFIHQQLVKLNDLYQKYGTALIVRTGKPSDVFSQLLTEFDIRVVFANKEYEPYARQRDKAVNELFGSGGIPFYAFKDHVMFEQDEVTKDDGTPYTVFTPYMHKWKQQVSNKGFKSYDTSKHCQALLPMPSLPVPALKDIGFQPSAINFPVSEPNQDIIRDYHLYRDFPALNGTTRIGVHLRFGTISVREMVSLARELNETWLNELIWREFFQAILFYFPHTVEKAFKPAYDNVLWINSWEHFKLWCEGRTGYPLVDAGMRELDSTGFMHNRVRMVTASFLCKHLLIDWRWGEAWFASKLLDYEQASNVGNWQWAAGSGCDAAPYFRVFNPSLQAQKFDPNGHYIKQWVPEADTQSYIQPIVNHDFARKRVLQSYKIALTIR